MLPHDLARWAADARADEAGRSRARQRWLRRQAEEEATFAGLLVDLAEREATVVARTSAGRRHRGVVAAVGADFVLLRHDGDRWTLLPFDAVTTLRVADDGTSRPASGDRAASLDLMLGEALDSMAGDGARVSVVATGDREPVAGRLEAVGADVLTVRLDGGGAAPAYVRLAAIAEVGLGAG